MDKSQTSMQPAKHILIVDDDDAIQAILNLALESENYQVTSAYSALEALAILKKDASPYDLIILDLYMPQMNGFEFAEQLKIQDLLGRKKVPIIVSSATNRPSEKEEAARFDYFLPKPFDLKKLFDACESLTR